MDTSLLRTACFVPGKNALKCSQNSTHLIGTPVNVDNMLFYDPILTGIDCTDVRLSVVFKIDERLLQKVLVKKKK